jgi:hypothetical protein
VFHQGRIGFTHTPSPPMALTMSPRKTDNQGRELIADQQLIHELEQFTQLAAELNRRLHSFTEETSTRNAKAAVNHLRAAAVLVQADI